MVYEVLARKWRPQVFKDVVGQEHITQTLINAINTDRLAHAYLFSGARGVGKTSVARILAKAINCQDRKDGDPCNRCTSCREITEGSSVDVQEIDGASNRGIDEIRELREYIKYMPSSSRYRVYIIDEVHMLTMQAFNALLKTLEEPPSHVKFIFATTEPHKVPITILSRCQRFDFKRIPLGLIVEQLRKVTDQEGIEIKRSGLSIIAGEADGSMRDAESLLDQVTSYTGSKVEDHHITDILGIIDRELLFESSGAIIDGSSKKCIEIVERIYNYGYDIKEFYRALMDQFRNLIVCLIVPEDDLLDMADEDKKELRIQAERAGLEKLQQSLNILITREEALRLTSHSRLVLETIMIKLCQLGDLLSMGELLEKIELLENRLSTSSFSHENIPAPSNISEPEPVWTGKEDDTAEQEAVNSGEGWDSLLNYLKSKNKAMYNVLAEWEFKSFKGDTLEIIKGKSPFSSVYLDDPERLRKFEKFCREFFKRDIEIKISNDNVNNSEKKTNITPPPKSDLPLPVQEVLEVFKGEIREEAFAGKEKTKKSIQKKQQGGISNERHT